MSRKLQVKRALQRDLYIMRSAGLMGLFFAAVILIWTFTQEHYDDAGFDSPTSLRVQAASAGFFLFSVLGYIFSYMGMVTWPYEDANFAGIKPEHRMRIVLRAFLALLMGIGIYGVALLIFRSTQNLKSDFEYKLLKLTTLVVPLLSFFLLSRFNYFNPKYAE